MVEELRAIEILRIKNELNYCRVCGVLNKKTLTKCGFCESTDLVEWDSRIETAFEIFAESEFKITYYVYTEDD